MQLSMLAKQISIVVASALLHTPGLGCAQANEDGK